MEKNNKTIINDLFLFSSQNEGETQVFEIQHIGYRDYIIRHHLTGLILTVHKWARKISIIFNSRIIYSFLFCYFLFSGSSSPCAPIVLCRSMGVRTPYQTVNFERASHQSDDFLIFLKNSRMVIDVDGGSLSSNARLLQFPQKKNNFDQPNQRFRLHPIIDRIAESQTVIIPAEFIR